MIDLYGYAANSNLIKFAPDGDKTGTFKGYGAVFGNRDAYGDVIEQGAFAKFLGKTIPMMYNHFEGVVGKITPVEEDSKGLVVEGEFTPGVTLANDVSALLKHGAVSGLSIRGRIGKDWSYDDKTNTRTIRKLDELMEISVVVFPANAKARVQANTIKSLDELAECETLKDVEAMLRDAFGLAPEAAKTVVSKSKPAYVRDALRAMDDEAKRLRTLAILRNIKGA